MIAFSYRVVVNCNKRFEKWLRVLSWKDVRLQWSGCWSAAVHPIQFYSASGDLLSFQKPYFLCRHKFGNCVHKKASGFQDDGLIRIPWDDQNLYQSSIE